MMWEKELNLLGVKKMPKKVLDRARLLKKLKKRKAVKKKLNGQKLRTRTWSGLGEGW